MRSDGVQASTGLGAFTRAPTKARGRRKSLVF